MTNQADMMTNGRGAAAVLAAAIGSLALALLALAGDASRSISAALNFWKPTGPLSGVTDVAILVWLGCWLLLSRRWATRDVNLARINMISFAMFVAALLITFPPIMDFLQGK
jgi:predicted transporter